MSLDLTLETLRAYHLPLLLSYPREVGQRTLCREAEMRKTLLNFLRSLASVVMGYIVIVVCTIAGFKPLGGIVHLHASLRIQAAGALVAIISGVLGGVTASIVAGRYPVRHATAVLIFLFVDTAVVLSRGSTDPVWFDLSGSAALMLATVSGGVLYRVVTRPRRLANQADRDNANAD
jgi:hypothetical protein